MKIEFQRLGRIFDPQDFPIKEGVLSHAANPVVVKMDEFSYRIFFNSRDLNQRSSVYSVDINLNSQRIIPDTLKIQFLLEFSDSYFKDGISLGSYFELDGVDWISFMGWINPPSEHWYGTIGRFRLNSNFDLESIEENPWFELDSDDPISLSYPTVYFSQSVMHIWYGSTLTWDGGNGEMVHILKEKISRDFRKFQNSNRFVEWKMGESQAFSRPSVVEVQDHFLLAYSVRGNKTKYRIGFGIIEDGSHIVRQIAIYPTSTSTWESEMVEYPCLVSHKDSIFMFYNGNGYGKSGIGLARIIVS
jgi:hypothetical protein